MHEEHDIHLKSSEVSKNNFTSTSASTQGQDIKNTTVNWKLSKTYFHLKEKKEKLKTDSEP